MTKLIRKQIRYWIPFEIRKKMYIWKTKIEDHKRGVEFASVCAENLSFSPILTIRQSLGPGMSDQTVHNLKLAIGPIHDIVLKPNQMFSFLHVVGEASPKREYQKSRSVRHGRLVDTYGGGICKLASLIYQATLQLGMEIVERYNHSIDIHIDEDSDSTLGADAAIAYPFKDLRIRNNHVHSFRFQFQLLENTISLTVEGTGFVPKQEIVYQVLESVGQKVVHTKNHHNELVAISVYRQCADGD